MAEFPDPVEFAEVVGEREVDANLTVRMAIDALLATRDVVARFADSEELGMDMYENPGSSAEEFGERLEKVRNALADELWSRQLFISVEILDDLLFQAIAKDPSSAGDSLLRLLQRLSVGVANADTLIVFPLHSFGIRLDDVFQRHVVLARPEWNLAVTSQSNDLGRTIGMLEDVGAQLGIAGAVPADLIEHWHRSRSARWLHSNPLLVAKVTALSGSYYGNEKLLMSRLQASSALIAMASTFQAGDGDQHPDFLSSRALNNFQTLDIHHYMLLAPGQHESSSSFVPISGLRSDVVEMSNLNVLLNPNHWSAADERAVTLFERLEALYSGYLDFALDPDSKDARASAYRKVFSALGLFKRSFSPDNWQATISLATAFEQLLVHGETKKLINRVKKRMGNILGGQEGAADHINAFEKLYEARCEILHEGRQKTKYDIAIARRAFVASFVAIAPLLNELDPHRRRPFLGSPDVSVGYVTVTLPGRGGHSPPSFSIAREISA